jgi:ribosomal protein S27E
MAKYLKVKCECGNEQIVYECTAKTIKCRVCGKDIAAPKGGKAVIVGEAKVTEELG